MLAKKKIIIAIIIILALIITGAFIFSRGDNAPTYETGVVKLGTLVQKVSVTGSVKPAEEVELAFEKSGKIASACGYEVCQVMGAQIPEEAWIRIRKLI